MNLSTKKHFVFKLFCTFCEWASKISSERFIFSRLLLSFLVPVFVDHFSVAHLMSLVSSIFCNIFAKLHVELNGVQNAFVWGSKSYSHPFHLTAIVKKNPVERSFGATIFGTKAHIVLICLKEIIQTIVFANSFKQIFSSCRFNCQSYVYVKVLFSSPHLMNVLVENVLRCCSELHWKTSR